MDYQNRINKQMDQNLKSLNILTRPNVSNGLWLCFLVPFCYFVNITLHWKAVPFDYKISTIISFGLLLQSICQFVLLAHTEYQNTLAVAFKLIIASITSFLIWICLKQGIIFSTVSGVFVVFLYSWLLFYLMRKLPHCFTLGEASIVGQGIVLFLFNCYTHLPFAWKNADLSQTDEFKAILQIGLLGMGLVSMGVYFTKFLRFTFLFYVYLTMIIGIIIGFPLTGKFPIVVISEFIFHDLERITIVGVYVLLLGASAAAVVWQTYQHSQSLTIVRKVFHFLIVLVYVPGLIYQCRLLYIASLIILALFILLETMRLINLYPVAAALNTAVSAFLDEKDAGGVALTPIYLLVGCSLPIWLHPSPCDITDSAGFNLFYLLAGILSVGVGDTAAGIIGSSFGKHKWPQSQKSVEGTLASIASQILLLVLLYSFKLIQMNSLKVATAGFGIIVNALIESKTDQVDNLILPLITFIIFSTAR